MEVACILCQVAADLCFDTQFAAKLDEAGATTSSSIHASPRLKGSHREPISVLGMITLADLDQLERESQTGRGWIACENISEIDIMHTNFQ